MGARGSFTSSAGICVKARPPYLVLAFRASRNRCSCSLLCCLRAPVLTSAIPFRHCPGSALSNSMGRQLFQLCQRFGFRDWDNCFEFMDFCYSECGPPACARRSVAAFLSLALAQYLRFEQRSYNRHWPRSIRSPTAHSNRYAIFSLFLYLGLIGTTFAL